MYHTPHVSILSSPTSRVFLPHHLDSPGPASPMSRYLPDGDAFAPGAKGVGDAAQGRADPRRSFRAQDQDVGPADTQALEEGGAETQERSRKQFDWAVAGRDVVMNGHSA